MANTKITSHVIANDAVTVDMITDAAVTADKLHATLDLSGKTLTLPATAIPSASTATTQSAADNSTKIATTAYVETAIANLNDSAPAALNTLNEIAAALGDDANYASTTTAAIAAKLPLAGGTMTGAIAMGTAKITGLGDPTANQDAGTKTYIDTADALKLNLSGGTLTGDLILNTTTALKLPVGTTAQRPSAATGQMRWNTSDGALEVYNGSAWTAVGTGSSNKILDTFTGDGSTTAFTLTVTPANEDALIVFIDGVYQEKGDYALSNAVLTLDTAPASGEKLAVHITTASVHDGTSGLNQQFTGDGSTVAFTLTQDPKSENNTQIYINGVYQQKTDYTVSGTTLTFDTAPETGDIIEVNMFTVTTLGNTDTVSEGTSNLYHTDARARGAISVSGNALSYNSSTGVITSAYEETPVFTGNVGMGGETSPDEALVINGGVKIKSTNYLSFSSTSDQTYIHAAESNVLAFGTDSTERLRIAAAGQVGIGGANYGTDGQVLTSTGASSAPAWESMGLNDLSNAVVSSSDPAYNTNPAGGVGTLWINTTSGEAYVCTDATTNSNVFINIGDGTGTLGFTGSGGTEGTFSIGSTNYKYHQFTSSGSFVSTGSKNIDILLVGGGGSGGGNLSGGGGAGGLLETTSQAITAGTYTVTIGAGGSGVNGSQTAGQGNNGTNTTFVRASLLSLSAIAGGGGDGGSSGGSGNSGGSGGGSSGYGAAGGAAGTSGQGNAGGGGGGGASNYPGGGGGGAGAVGQTSSSSAGPGGDGGVGVQKNYNGTNHYWAGGGGGGHYTNGGETGSGGNGGGGSGGADSGTLGAGGSGLNAGGQGFIGGGTGKYGGNAGANTGGGGGGTGHNSTQFANYTSGNGGSGICIIRYEV